MENLKNFCRVNKIKVIATVVAIVVVLFCAFVGTKLINNDNQQRIAETTENYGVKAQEKMIADAVVQSGTVTVYYVDESGKEISTKSVKEGNVGDWYEVERRNVTGYISAGEEPITRAGRYAVGNTDVRFVYKSAKSAVKTKVENEGVNGATENSAYVVFDNPRIATDYGIKIITKDENGKVINGGIFKVSKDGDTLKEGEVRDGSIYVGKIAVKEDGEKIYEIEEIKATPGYKKIEDIIDLGINATWNDETKKFDISLDEINEAGVTARIENGEIIIEIVNEKYKDAYEIEIVNKCGNELITGGKFKVIEDGTTIKEDYVTNGKLEIGIFEVSDNGEEIYTFIETETVEGYTTVIGQDNPGKVKVIKTWNEEEQKYDITIEYSNIEGFSAEIKDGKITVYVETELVVEKYDLCMKKFISEVDGKLVEGREPVVGLDEEGKITYTQTGDMIKVSNEQKVTYTLRIYNESENQGKGKRIIENIPDGLVFLPANEKNIEYGWKLYIQDEDGNLEETEDIEKANVIVTDCLVDKEINGFNYEKMLEDKELSEDSEILASQSNYIDAQIVFEVDESKITSEDRIIENTVVIEKNEYDDNTDNDVSTEKVYVKYFDLDLVKYIKEVKVKNNIKETVQEVGLDKKGQLVKIDVAKTEVENTTITVTYGLIVKNIGEIEGYATEVIDYIPQDFKLVQDGNWKVKGDKAVTTKLENKLLQPGESTTIEITFEWKLTESNIGSRINEGKITEYENPYNAKDPTENNNDKEEMIVQVRTGEGLYYLIPVIIVIGMLAIIIVIVKDRYERKTDISAKEEKK